MTVTLSRMERAAMELVLHSLRNDIITHFDASGTGLGQAVLAFAPVWLDIAVRDARRELLEKDWRTAMRILRARLALALRVLLRVDRGDYGRVGMICTACGEERGHKHCGCCSVHYGERFCSCWGKWRDGLAPVRPLWESAPGWDAAISPAQRRAEKRGG